MRQEDRVEGKVAKILNARELVINRGERHGVTVGMRLAVLDPRGLDVPDPDTGDVLGSIDIPKVLVKVVRVGDNLAVASTFRTYRVGGTGLFGMGNVPSHPSEDRVETLRTSEKTHKEELKPQDSYVHVGDPVIEFHEGDYEGWGAE